MAPHASSGAEVTPRNLVPDSFAVTQSSLILEQTRPVSISGRISLSLPLAFTGCGLQKLLRYTDVSESIVFDSTTQPR